MKKVIFCAAALVFAGLSYGQTPTTPNSPTQAAVLPLADPLSANRGDATQTGLNQQLGVLQVGTVNSALTEQHDGTGSGHNKARIQQIGELGPSSGIGNWSEINQMGSFNQTLTDQRGDHNMVLVDQGQNNTASSNNSAQVQQGGVTGHAEINKAEVSQDGTENLSYTKQTSDKNEALTIQDGDENKSRISQQGSPNMSEGQAAEVWQRGSSNQAQVGQLAGAGARNEATSIQLGDGNSSLQLQRNSAVSLSTNNAFVSQGDGAESVSRSNLMPLFNYIDANVDNIDNGVFSGMSYNAIAIQEQDGTLNDAEIHQFGADAPALGNYAHQLQNGERNTGLVVQNAFGNPNGGGNSVFQEQIGNDNALGIVQNGSGHEALQRQTNDWNVALSTQRGNGNMLNTRQEGGSGAFSRAVMFTAQRGNDNLIIAQQHGTNSANISQNGTANEVYFDQYLGNVAPGVLAGYETHTPDVVNVSVTPLGLTFP